MVMNDMQAAYLRWNTATAALPPGVHATLKDVLSLVAEEKVHIVYHADYSAGSPCLINSIAQMLSVTNGQGGSGIPMQHFAPLVAEFDRINGYLREQGVNTDHRVSPLAADVLLRYYAPERPLRENHTEASEMEEFASNFPMDAEMEQLAKDFVNSYEIDLAHADVEGNLSSSS